MRALEVSVVGEKMVVYAVMSADETLSQSILLLPEIQKTIYLNLLPMRLVFILHGSGINQLLYFRQRHTERLRSVDIIIVLGQAEGL